CGVPMMSDHFQASSTEMMAGRSGPWLSTIAMHGRQRSSMRAHVPIAVRPKRLVSHNRFDRSRTWSSKRLVLSYRARAARLFGLFRLFSRVCKLLGRARQEQGRHLAAPGAERVEVEELDRLGVGHAVALHEDFDALVGVVDGQRWVATAFRHADEGVLVAVRQQRLRVELGGPVAQRLEGVLIHAHRRPTTWN